MFDIGWSELLVLGVVTLVLVGPKELPGFLRMIGRYLGVIRRHANEFRAVFDQAMREAEMDSLKDEMRNIGDGVKKTFDDAARSVDDAKVAMRVDLNTNKAVQPPSPERAPSKAASETHEAASAPATEDAASDGTAAPPVPAARATTPVPAAQPSKDDG